MRAHAAIVVGLAGCLSRPTADPGSLCDLSPICPEGQTCINGVCLVGEPPDGGALPPPPPPPPPGSNRRSTLALSAPGEPLVNFPLLVTLFAVRADMGLLGSGQDLRFFDKAGNVLPHEIEPGSAAGTLLVWVRVPRIEGTSTEIEVDYGRAAQVPRSTELVWAGYEAVFHFAEASGAPQDSSPKLRHGTAAGTPLPAPSDGQVGRGRTFSGTGSIIVNAPDFNPSAITVSGWFREANVAGPDNEYHALVARQRGTDGENDIWLGNALGSITAWYGVSGDQAEIRGPAGDTALKYLAMTAGPMGARLYVNGELRGTPGSTPFVRGAANPIMIGADRNNTSSGPPNVDWHDGMIDEVRIESRVQSAAWIKFEYLSMRDMVINYGVVNVDP